MNDESSIQYRAPYIQRDGFGIENDTVVRVTEPEFDRGNPLAAEIEGADRAFLLGFAESTIRLASFILEDRNRPGKIRNATQIGRYFTVAMHCLDHPLVRGLNMTDLGDEMQCTKACISKIANQFRDEYGIAGIDQRSAKAREAYRKSATETHKRRKEKAANEVAASMTAKVEPTNQGKEQPIE